MKPKFYTSNQRKFDLHVATWQDCKRCDLCKTRKNVVISRGNIPAHVLFFGEAPGESEDSLGDPFVGEAGHLLDRFIAEVYAHVKGWKYAITNTVGCIPYNENPDAVEKLRDPNKKEITACRPRVLEFINLVKPKLIVCLGQVAGRALPPEGIPEHTKLQLMHPAAMLRQHGVQASISEKRFFMTLKTAIQNLEL